MFSEALNGNKFPAPKFREGDRSLVWLTHGVSFLFATTVPLFRCSAIIVYWWGDFAIKKSGSFWLSPQQ